MNKLVGAAIFPTGIGLSIGGDASAGAVIPLLASCSKKLIVNPNGVNASDLVAWADNVLYTEGSTIDRFLEGSINLKECRTYNKILCVVNKPMSIASQNAVNAARWTLGADIELLELDTPLRMTAFINPDGTAGGKLSGHHELVKQIKDANIDYDILTVHTLIDCPDEIANAYWRQEILVNPWGRVEALLSKFLSFALDKQAVHSPVEFLADPLFNRIAVKPSEAAEVISNTFAWCMFKGTHRAPMIDPDRNPRNLSNQDMDFLISPSDCWGRPHDACLQNHIPILIVKENTTCFKDFKYPMVALESSRVIFVENYLEAAGMLMAWNAGIDPRIIRA
jgi:hypothetical protein